MGSVSGTTIHFHEEPRKFRFCTSGKLVAEAVLALIESLIEGGNCRTVGSLQFGGSDDRRQP